VPSYFPFFPGLLVSISGAISTYVYKAIHDTLSGAHGYGCWIWIWMETETILLLEEWWRLLAGCQISGMAIEKWKASSGGNCSSARPRPPTCRPLFQGALLETRGLEYFKLQDPRFVTAVAVSTILILKFMRSQTTTSIVDDCWSSTIGDVIACSKRVSRIYFYNFLPCRRVQKCCRSLSLEAFVFAELLVAIFMAYWLSY